MSNVGSMNNGRSAPHNTELIGPTFDSFRPALI